MAPSQHTDLRSPRDFLSFPRTRSLTLLPKSGLIPISDPMTLPKFGAPHDWSSTLGLWQGAEGQDVLFLVFLSEPGASARVLLCPEASFQMPGASGIPNPNLVLLIFIWIVPGSVTTYKHWVFSSPPCTFAVWSSLLPQHPPFHGDGSSEGSSSALSHILLLGLRFRPNY